MPLQIVFSEMNTLLIFRGYFRQLFPLSLTSSACVKSSCLLTISKNRRYRKCYMPLSKWMPWPSFGVTFGNFRPLVSVFIETYTITWNARYRQLVNTIMLMNTLAILRGTFGNFRPLSLTTSTCVNLHRDLYHYLERALSPNCEQCNVNEHPRNPSGYFR